MGTGSSTQIDLQLQRPTREMTKLTKLSGEIVFAVPSERHKYVFKKFGNGARQVEKFGEVEITLEGARRNNAVYEIRVLAEIDNDEVCSNRIAAGHFPTKLISSTQKADGLRMQAGKPMR